MSHPTLSRRSLIGWVGVTTALSALPARGGSGGGAKSFPVRHSDAEWKQLLTPAQYYILRQQGTERPYTSALHDEHRRGTFLCAADGSQLYSSATRFDSHTGWPSFWRPLRHAIGTSTDISLGVARTEVHCARCGGHLGHVFEDGPPPTGKRYCMNGDAMRFRPA